MNRTARSDNGDMVPSAVLVWADSVCPIERKPVQRRTAISVGSLGPTPHLIGPRVPAKGKIRFQSGGIGKKELRLEILTPMKILTRYVIRAHIGPFLFAFTALTALIFLNAIAQRLDDLAGRGLELLVIGEFFVLSLPHVIALTFPMSILVATLYVFSQLTGNNEVAAMAAGGIHPIRLILPLVGVGLALSATVFFFNDQVLPEANHRLSSLLTNIGSKSPTFELREEIVNEIHTEDDTKYFLRASSIDPRTNELQNVTIFDLSETGQLRTIIAEHGRMAFTANLRDLVLTLENGVVFEVSDTRPGTFQQLRYDTQILPLHGVAEELERQVSGSRSDREMTVRMLQTEVNNSVSQLQIIGEESLLASREAVDAALRGMTEEELASQSSAQTATGPEISPTTLVRGVSNTHRMNRARWDVYRLSSARYLVEIHKKYAISFACIIFFLLGPPLAMRFPQGGIGMVVAASVGIFFLYWMGLIGGERFADEGQVNPIFAMWASNLFLMASAILLLWKVADRISTNRGSTWTQFLVRIKTTIDRGSRRSEAPLTAGEA